VLSKKTLFITAFMLLMVFVVLPAFAAEKAEEATGGGANKFTYFSAAVFSGGFAMAVGSLMTSLGQGRAISSACDGIARNPGAAARIQTAMIIGLAFIESLAIYVLVTVLIIFFVDPFGMLG
jgi:F-type H+-transporting ATPase subunit c